MATIVATMEIVLTQIIKFNNKFKYNASKETILAHMANNSFSVKIKSPFCGGVPLLGVKWVKTKEPLVKPL